MTDPHLIDLAKWAAGTLGGFLVFVAGAIGMLFRVSFKLGADAREIKEALKDIGEMKADVRKIPIIEAKLDTLANTSTEDRRRFNSVVPEMQQKVTTLWEKVFSLSEWRKSRPNLNGNGNGHDGE